MDMVEKLIQGTLIPTERVKTRKEAIAAFEVAISHIVLNLNNDCSETDRLLAKHSEWLLVAAMANLQSSGVIDFEKLRGYVQSHTTS